MSERDVVVKAILFVLYISACHLPRIHEEKKREKWSEARTEMPLVCSFLINPNLTCLGTKEELGAIGVLIVSTRNECPAIEKVTRWVRRGYHTHVFEFGIECP